MAHAQRAGAVTLPALITLYSAVCLPVYSASLTIAYAPPEQQKVVLLRTAAGERKEGQVRPLAQD